MKYQYVAVVVVEIYSCATWVKEPEKNYILISAKQKPTLSNFVSRNCKKKTKELNLIRMAGNITYVCIPSCQAELETYVPPNFEPSLTKLTLINVSTDVA